jgi:hypothetical protein
VAMIPRYRYRHDDGAEDQGPHRGRRPYDIVGELVGESDPLAKLDNSCSSNAGGDLWQPASTGRSRSAAFTMTLSGRP